MTYDEVADAAYLYLVDSIGPGGAPTSALVPIGFNGASIIVSLDHEYRANGVEFLGASRLFTPEALEVIARDRAPFDYLPPAPPIAPPEP